MLRTTRFEYLMEHWEQEQRVVGLEKSEYEVTKPGCFNECKVPLLLDPAPVDAQELVDRYNVPPMRSFGAPAASAQAAPFGTLLGTAPGNVPVYSCYCRSEDARGPLGAEAEESTIQVLEQTCFCGLRWQCVEFARRWLVLTRGLSFTGIDYASEIFDLPELLNVATGLSAPWRAVLNGSECGSSGRPVVGALLIWDKGGAFEQTGHVAVITEVTGSAVRIAEQNYGHVPWPEGRDFSRELILSTEPVAPPSPAEATDLITSLMKFTITDPDLPPEGTCIKGWKILPDDVQAEL